MLATLRKPKIADVAIFDVAATFLTALALTGINCGAIIVFILLIMIGIVVHAARRIPTRLNAYLGINTVAEVYAKR